MLDKFIIRKKNIIFFKVIIHIALITIISLLLLLTKEGLTQSIRENKKAQTLLDETSSKLNSISNFKEEVLNTKRKYKALVKNANQTICATRTEFISKINSLSRKYNLFDPIKIDIIKKFRTKDSKFTHKNIKIDDYDVTIEFNSTDNESLLLMLKELGRLLPMGSIVQNINIQTAKPLTPKMISSLNKERAPGLINTQMQIELREIVYEK